MLGGIAALTGKPVTRQLDDEGISAEVWLKQFFRRLRSGIIS